MKIKSAMVVVCVIFSAVGCTPFVDVLDVKSVPAPERAAASSLQIMGVGTHPNNAQYIGPVEGTSCKHWLTDPPSSMANATEQLKIKALRMGANAVMDYSCTSSGTDTYGTNCWSSISCAGTAVKIP
jgi:uncharacterized protein YbjQ (UPF0145 family)